MATFAISAPPSVEDDQLVAGEWEVQSPKGARLYEIKANRNIRIEGGGLKDKTGKMRPQEDGSYIVDVEGAILRLIHLKANDKLIVEYYSEKKDIERKLTPTWKADASRKTSRK